MHQRSLQVGPLSLRVSGQLDLRIVEHLQAWRMDDPIQRPDVTLEVLLERVPSTWAPLNEDGTLGRFQWTPSSSCLQASLDGGLAAEWTALRLAFNVAAWRAGGMLLHATGLVREPGQCVLGLAVSGGGKSTLTDLAEEWLGLSDETVLIAWKGELPTAHGMPFRSTAKKAPAPVSCALSALLLLEKSPVPSFEKVPIQSALARVLGQLYRPPASVASSAQILHRAKLLAESVPAYRFRFPKSPAANDLLKKLFDEELSR